MSVWIVNLHEMISVPTYACTGRCTYYIKSTKASGDAHGLGHQIVERIVADYHGMIEYFEEYDMFGVQIILPEAGKEHS